jgi:hypothetical protein
MVNQKASLYFIAIASMFLFFWMGYKVERHETATLLTLYAALFGLYTWIILQNQTENVTFWIGCSIVFRLVLLFSVPNLSDDFYRFIWDGRLLATGEHPFAHIPSYYIEHTATIAGIDESLYSKLNSKYYYTIYPPVAQFMFWFAAKVSSSVYGSLIILKSFNIVSEIGSIIVLQKLLVYFSLARERALIYALNPLIILELTGNAHFEAVMIFLVLLSLYFILTKRQKFSSISIALSIGVKLIPIIFLPAIIQVQGWKNAFRYWAVAIPTSIILFLPLMDYSTLTGFQNSIPYFFSRFEFNASIYYFIRELGYVVFGHNIIYIAGPLLGVIAFLIILHISINGLPRVFLNAPDSFPAGSLPIEWRYIQTLAGCLLIYYLFTTTLHPWYIATLLALSVFSNFRFVILWSFSIFFSYAGYSDSGFSENLWLVAVEYISVLGFFAYELWKKSSTLNTARVSAN